MHPSSDLLLQVQQQPSTSSLHFNCFLFLLIFHPWCHLLDSVGHRLGPAPQTLPHLHHCSLHPPGIIMDCHQWKTSGILHSSHFWFICHLMQHHQNFDLDSLLPATLLKECYFKSRPQFKLFVSITTKGTAVAVKVFFSIQGFQWSCHYFHHNKPWWVW